MDNLHVSRIQLLIRFKKDVEVKWIDSSEVTDDNVAQYLADVDGILVPGGFGFRASEGKISAIKYARENNVPYFGICLGMQLATVVISMHLASLHIYLLSQ